MDESTEDGEKPKREPPPQVECPKCFNPNAKGLMLRRTVIAETEHLKTETEVPIPTIVCDKCGARTEMYTEEEIRANLNSVLAAIEPQAEQHAAEMREARERHMLAAKRCRRSAMWYMASTTVMSSALLLNVIRVVCYPKLWAFWLLGIASATIITFSFFQTNRIFSRLTGEYYWKKEKDKPEKVEI